jgi:hypothetical protein
LKKKLVLFLGSGFSAALGLPTTAQLSEKLLQSGDGGGEIYETFITATIGKFWEDVFGWQPGMRPPTLEDHFTQIDLAANSGHHLGAYYDPKKLRAIRRWTIHRALSQLGPAEGEITAPVGPLFMELDTAFDLTLVTTNWDTEAEWCLSTLGILHDLGVDEIDQVGDPFPRQDVAVLKLHGCASRGYCDCCRNGVAFKEIPDGIARFKLLLKEDDFRLFHDGASAAASVVRAREDEAGAVLCPRCGAPVGFRIGTFSYRKHLDSPAFYTTWEQAQTKLQYADKWLFIGYSLPEADIEIRHLLKSTQLARKDPGSLSVDIVLKEDGDAGERYSRFFGTAAGDIFQGGLEDWVSERLEDYCQS